MAPSRHKHMLPKAPSARRRMLRLAVPVVAVAALGGTTTAVAWPDDAPAKSSAAITFDVPEPTASPVPVRVAPISRSAERVQLKAKPPAPPKAVGHRFALDAVNVRTKPSAQAPLAGALEFAEKVAITGRSEGEWAEVLIAKQVLWVHADFLAEEKPEPEPEPEPEAEEEPAEAEVPAGVSDGACPSGSDVENGLVANAVAVHRAVCAAFPSITSYGGVRNDSGEHGSGRALDVMVSGDLGWQVAEYVRSNAGDLGVSEVIYSQKIWTVERSGEGWRSMEDRGSSTANHYDHVHVTVY